ncbi:MAG: methyltransferase domain-containing protein [Deltaproteobacteria bacterium]|nr:methyltransferase domain-containing protein [Deltaproteobacteria bacterium]
MIKADYSEIASYYDKGRTLTEKNLMMWLDLVAKFSRASAGAKVLDLGCGTGRFSLPMAARLGFDMTGVDSSAEMLVKAMEKDSNFNVRWILGDAQALAFPAGSFEIAFMSHLLHHCNHPPMVLKECYRVLVPSGIILIRYGTMDQIRNDAEHTFFPEAVEIDQQRIFSRERLEKWLLDAGFVDISSQEIMQQTYKTGAAHLDAARAKSTSVLSMISEESFQAGLRRLEDHVAGNPNDKWLLCDRMTLTLGRKSKFA